MAPKTSKSNKKSKPKPASDAGAEAPQMTPEMMAELNKMRDTILARLGQTVLSFIGVPRYAHQSVGDLQHFCLAPLVRDRIAIATTEAKPVEGQENNLTSPLLGIAIWASVSSEVDAKIREQAGAGIFPVKLAPTDWNSGDIVWLLDIIAPTPKLATSVIANFRQVLDAKDLGAKASEMRLHPIIKRMLGDEVLQKMGARPMGENTKPEKKVAKPKTKSKTTVKKVAKKTTKAGGKDSRTLN